MNVGKNMEKEQILLEDMKKLEQSVANKEELYGKTILVTGATGMLAQYCIYFLMYLNRAERANIKVVALGRNKEKMKNMFGEYASGTEFEMLIQDVCEPICYDGDIQYMIHAAGSSSPYYIKNAPLDIINANYLGTRNVLELARQNPVRNIVFTSTREIYGEVEGKEWITEQDMGILNPLDARSCYPESKRMAEQLFRSYYQQYQVPFVITRIAHSYGPGMIIDNDGRVMSDFIGDVVHSRDIVMTGDGMAIRAFCYTVDAVAGIFISLLRGTVGEAYNIANEEEPILLKDLAEKLVHLFPERKLSAVYQKTQDQSGYCAYKRVGLSTDKLRALGWRPQVSLEEGLYRTVMSF